LTDRGIKYLTDLVKLPKDGPERLVFFQQYLEDADEMLARDAYDEFARAPYAQLKSIKDQLQHDQVVAWIKNQDIPASRRRLELADLVIPDLAKWEDWSVMDRLFELYKTANDKNSWVRVPVVNYLRACPLPKAKELLDQCEKIDPSAVRRANMFPGAAPAPAA